MKKALTFVSATLGSVMLAFAQISINLNGVAGQGQVNGGALLSLLALAQTLVSRFVPFLIGLAVVAFFWYLVEFIWKGREDAKEKTHSLRGMGYAIIALFVMVSIWGLVGFLGSMLGVGQGGSVPIPGVPVPTN